ncbi:MAG: hypothetical protein M0Z56_04430 [Desulfobacteraceae bacterium]|nr:hypothetical protein [Desulfobacteraceae bacterium]
MEKTDRRAIKERRISDRRSANDTAHQEENQRKILDRRCGIDRRQTI